MVKQTPAGYLILLFIALLLICGTLYTYTHLSAYSRAVYSWSHGSSCSTGATTEHSVTASLIYSFTETGAPFLHQYMSAKGTQDTPRIVTYTLIMHAEDKRLHTGRLHLYPLILTEVIHRSRRTARTICTLMEVHPFGRYTGFRESAHRYFAMDPASLRLDQIIRLAALSSCPDKTPYSRDRGYLKKCRYITRSLYNNGNISRQDYMLTIEMFR